MNFIIIRKGMRPANFLDASVFTKNGGKSSEQKNLRLTND